MEPDLVVSSRRTRIIEHKLKNLFKLQKNVIVKVAKHWGRLLRQVLDSPSPEAV